MSSPPRKPRSTHLAQVARPWRLLFLVYFVLLTIGTHLPSTDLTGQGSVLPDKLIHFFAFGILTLLLWRSRLIPLAWLVPAAVSVWIPIDEWTQQLAGPGRVIALDDMIAGWMGVATATSLIFVLSPWGSTPLRASRRRFHYLMDQVVADRRVGLRLIFIPSIAFLILFFVPWTLAEYWPPMAWAGTYVQSLFLGCLAVTVSIGLLLLTAPFRAAATRLREETPCLDCGEPLSLDTADEHGGVTCPTCSSYGWGAQWEPLVTPPTVLSITPRFILGLACFLVVAVGWISLGELILQSTPPTFAKTIELPLFLLGAAIGAAAATAIIAGLTSRKVTRMGWTCPACTFDLSGAPSQAALRRCPECTRMVMDWQNAQRADEVHFERHARTVMSITAVSRVTGLAREAVLSRILGTDALLSSYYFAFLVPNLFRRLFGEGALAAAFLPTYEKLNREDPVIARQLASATMGIVLVITGVLVAIAELIVVAISAMMTDPGPALWLLMIMLPYAPLVCVVAILGAMLQVHGRFGPTAAAPIVLNATITAAAIIGYTVFGLESSDSRLMLVEAMSIAVVLAGLIQVAWSWIALRSHEKIGIRLSGARDHVREMFRKAGPMILGLGVLQVNTLIDGLIASYANYRGSRQFFDLTWPLDEHAMAVLNFAQRLYQFPLGVFGIAVATAIYPMLSRLADDRPAFSDMVRRGLRLVFFIGFPASLGLMIVARPLTATILQGGAFSSSDTGRVAFVLLGYASCVWAYSMIQVVTRAFYAKGDTMTPVRIAISVVVLNLVLNLVLIWTPLREAGLAWSTAICATLQLTILLRYLRRHVDLPLDRSTRVSFMKTVALTLVMVVALEGVMLMPFEWYWIQYVQQLATLVLVGTLVIAGGAKLLGMPELRWALGGRASPNGG
ncbi:MAG: murein biosynthesis integral membrane protein MurJ [Phycisphaerales bacterium]|nr:murein biosynthesis integral membrane protein MurJ [Phycisphaerales bacterium]